MTDRRALKPVAGDADSIEVRIDRLIAANEALQARVAAHLEAEQHWQAERKLLRAMLDQVPDYLFVKDTDSRFVVANRAVAADVGLDDPADIIGKQDFDLHSAEIASGFYAEEQKVMATGEPLVASEQFIVDANGRRKWLSTTKVPLRDESGEIIGLIGVCRDVTERKRAEEQIYFMAHHDSLTGLPNRVLLMDRLTQAIHEASRDGNRVTTIFIDLDNFKLVNDSLGHSAGDKLLRVISERMAGCVRPADTVVRLGGDEFVVLLVDRAGSQEASVILDRIRVALAEPVAVEGQTFRITCSIGLATFPEDGDDAETLLMNADVAMYQAKEKGRDNYQFYTREMSATARERRLLQEGLRAAVARNEFALLYQPRVDLGTGRILAVEALVRWHHPELGIIEPAKFVPMAEETGVIVVLGDWVLREACRQNKAWQRAGIEPICVCVNVSARQVRERNWVKRVEYALRESGLDPHYLELELTESLLMRDTGRAATTMRTLQAIGVQFAIDDFGTGYSSLSALKSFPVGRLKIDQAFVRNLPYDENDRSIATAVISLGKKLNMKVVAEGVETAAQVAFLKNHDCDEIQGYHFSRPLDADALAALLRRQAS